MKKALIIGLIMELVIGVIALCGYFFYYTRTPGYSIQQARNAFNENNLTEFKRYVDIDGIMASKAEDIANYIPANDTTLQASVKNGQLAATAVADIDEYFKNGKWEDKNDVTDIDNLLYMSGLKTFSFRAVEYVEKDLVDENGKDLDGSIATAGIRIYEPTFGDSFVLICKLHQQPDGRWQVYDITNYDEFLQILMAQHKKELKRYADKVAEIVNGINDKFDQLKTTHPKIDKDWVTLATNSMKEANEKLELLTVPTSGKQIDSLLDERRSIFFDLSELYYEQAEKHKSKSLPTRIEEKNRLWNENKAKLQKLLDDATGAAKKKENTEKINAANKSDGKNANDLINGSKGTISIYDLKK